MTRLAPLFPAFSTAFGAIYLACMHFNIAAFVYYPVLGEWHAARIENADAGPPMFYYGWLFNALIGSAVFALAAAVIPQSVARKVWPTLVWAVPGIMLVLSVYLMRIWF